MRSTSPIKQLLIMISVTSCGYVLAGALPAYAGGWVADTKSGCQIWNPNPQLRIIRQLVRTVCARGRARRREGRREAA